MGCGASRFEQRNENLDDLNCVSLNFVDCSDLTCYDLCPVDKFVMRLGKQKELSALFNIIDLKAQHKQAIMINFEEIISCLKSQQELLERESLDQTRIKEPLEGCKYKMSEATGQIQNAIGMLERFLTKINDTQVLDETKQLLLDKSMAEEKFNAEQEAKDSNQEHENENEQPEQVDNDQNKSETKSDKPEEQENENSEQQNDKESDTKPDQAEDKADDITEEKNEEQAPEESKEEQAPEENKEEQAPEEKKEVPDEQQNHEPENSAPAQDEQSNAPTTGDAQDDSLQLEGGSLKGNLSVSGSPYQYANDDYNYAGWEDIPAMILKVFTMNPYYADIARSQIMKWEFNYNKEQPEQQQWLKVAGIVNQTVNSAQNQNGEIWFSGLVGDQDYQNLKDMASNQSNILFPGVIIGWKTQAEAEIACYMLNKAGSKTYHRVMFFCSNCESLKFLNCRYYSYRLHGKVKKMVTKENQEHTYFNIEGSTPSGHYQMIEEWEEQIKK